jgi:nicotinamide riboside kinase
MQAQLICLIGAECTGKTSLAQALSEQLNGLWVPEYLRTFCNARGRTPTQQEQAHIMETQFQHEAAARQLAGVQCKRWVFCDTAPLLTAVYSDFIFCDTSLLASARMLHTRYALTLLLEPDIAWVADGVQRDGDHVRAPIQTMLEAELARIGHPVARVSGAGPARLVAALQAIAGVDVN